MHHHFITAICPQRVVKSLKSESERDCRVSLHLGKKVAAANVVSRSMSCSVVFFL